MGESTKKRNSKIKREKKKGLSPVPQLVYQEGLRRRKKPLLEC